MALPVGIKILSALKAGLSATAALRSARADGVKIRTQTWYSMFGAVKAAVSDNVRESHLPLNAKPRPQDILPFPSKIQTGYLQYVDVLVRERDTGLVKVRPFTVKRQTLMTRGEAVRIAEDAISAAAEKDPSTYNEDVLFGMYSATYKQG